MGFSNRGPLGQRPEPAFSQAVRDSARGEECSLRLGCCNHDKETTVFAHLRFFTMAGMGMKPPDHCGVYACFACRNAIDGRTQDPWEFEDLLRALMETQSKLFRKGLLRFK